MPEALYGVAERTGYITRIREPAKGCGALWLSIKLIYGRTFIELYSEEIPPQLQIGARTQLKEFIESSFNDNEIKYNELLAFSSPTRLVL